PANWRGGALYAVQGWGEAMTREQWEDPGRRSRIIRRSNRLLKMMELDAPEIVCRNEALSILRAFALNYEPAEMLPIVEEFIRRDLEVNELAETYNRDHPEEVEALRRELEGMN